jgi:signal transduction histidine kinase
MPFEEAIDRHRHEALIAQSARVAGPMILAALFVSAFLGRTVPLPLLAAWIAAVVLMLWWRRSSLIRWRRLQPAVALRRAGLISIASGLVHAAPIVLFFPRLGVAERALLTMVFISQAAISISTSGFHLPAYRAYSRTLLVPLAGAWALTGLQPLGPAIGLQTAFIQLGFGLLILMFLFIQDGFARQAERTFVESFRIRYENQELLEKLEVERAALAQERDRAEAASRAKSRFLAVASHDLRQPMHTMSLLTAALSLLKLDPTARTAVAQMTDAVDALSTQLDALLDISKLDAGVVSVNLQPVSLPRLFERLGREMEPLARGRTLRLDLSSPAALAIRTDPVLFERILRNLVDNALKYTEHGSVVVDALEVDGSVVVRVCDTGCGIDAPERERIFDEFYQVPRDGERVAGLGLGLSVVKRLSELLGIRLDLTSTPGVGSTFELKLGAAVVLHTNGGREEDTGADNFAGLRILVVDDDRQVVSGMRTLLEALGCTVDAANTVGEAEAAARQQRPDLVLADLRLAGQETGVQAIETVRRHCDGVPALLISADIAPERLRDAAAVGVPLLHKPVSSRTLRHAITEAMRGGS